MEITEELRAKYWKEFESKYGKFKKILTPQQFEDQFKRFVEDKLKLEQNLSEVHEMVETASKPVRDKLAADQQKLADELAKIERERKNLKR